MSSALMITNSVKRSFIISFHYGSRDISSTSWWLRGAMPKTQFGSKGKKRREEWVPYFNMSPIAL
jgi:hypothetical protein